MPLGGQVVQEVADPGVVGVAAGRHAPLPALVVLQQVAAPVADVEGGIGQHDVGLEVGVLVAVEAVALLDVAIQPTNSEVHLAELPGGVVQLLTVEGRLAATAAVGLDEPLTLHEHAARATGGVVDAIFVVRRKHRDQKPHHALRGVELAARLTLGRGELADEVLVDATQQILALALLAREVDLADGVDQLAEPALVELRPGISLVEHAAQAVVLLLDAGHRLVELDPDRLGAGLLLQLRPAGGGRNPEDIVGGVLVAILGIRPFDARELGPVSLEAVGDVLEEDQPEHVVLVDGRLQVAPQLVGDLPQLLLEADVGGRVLLGLTRAFLGHRFSRRVNASAQKAISPGPAPSERRHSLALSNGNPEPAVYLFAHLSAERPPKPTNRGPALLSD